MPMLLAQRWWVPVVRGVAAVVFGILCWVRPGLSLLTLVLLFGAYALVDGAFNLVLAIRGRHRVSRWGMLVVEGLASIAAGVLAFIWPGITALVLLYIIAAWAVVTGILEIGAAIRLRKTIRGEWMLAIAGVLSIAFGVLLAMFPGAGALTVVLWIGAYCVVFGALLIALGFRLRAWQDKPAQPSAPGQHLPTGGVPAT
jgi:uncharacterized membrane protein HdeD (DUF308 family)